MKKRILSLILALLLMVSLVACAGSGGVEGTWSLDVSGSLGTQDFSGLTGTGGAGLYVVAFVFDDGGFYLADMGSVHGDHIHDADGDASGKYTVDAEGGTITFDGTHTYAYTCSGSTLTLTDDAGNTFNYKK